jgi:hypothetical protein
VIGGTRSVRWSWASGMSGALAAVRKSGKIGGTMIMKAGLGTSKLGSVLRSGRFLFGAGENMI